MKYGVDYDKLSEACASKRRRQIIEHISQIRRGFITVNAKVLEKVEEGGLY